MLRARTVLPGLAVAFTGAAVATGLHQLSSSIGVLTWAVLLGAVAANVGILASPTRPGLQFAVRRLLRVGVVLLGLSLSLTAIAALGVPVIALVVTTLLVTLLVTAWLGRRLKLGRNRALMIAVGFSICGASAIAAAEEPAGADEDDVAVAIAMVTICGTVAMLALPLLQAPLGLSDEQFGIWAGASVHEVGQVVGAAGPAGAAAVAVAVVVKLTRVLMLAPVVAGISMWRRRGGCADSSTSRRSAPIVPLFVIGFFGCVVLRSLHVVPPPVLDVGEEVANWALAAALFGLGTGVHLPSLWRGGGPAIVLASVSTLLVSAVALAGVVSLVRA